MRKRITNNWGLKLASFIFALLLWLVVVNVDNPVKSKTFDNVQVKLQSTSLITSEGLVYEVLDSSDTISVSVSAPRSYLELLSKDDIVAVADFNNITAANTINITYYSKRYNDKITNFKGSTESVKLNIEEERMLQLVLKTDTTGEVEEGYIVGKITTDQNQVRISGPESMVSQIKNAKISVDVSGTTTDIATYADVKLYDEEGNEISSSSIKQNVDSVKVGVEILATKTVPINYTVSGTPAAGYRVTGEITSTPAEVQIAGSTDTLEDISKIDVPAEALSVAGKNTDVAMVINLNNYLPEGVRFADSSFGGRAAVNVLIEEEISTDLNLSESNIEIVNIPEGYTAVEAEDNELILMVSGLKADVSRLLIADVVGTVDIAAYMEEQEIQELESGIYVIEATFELEGNITITEPVMVNIMVEKVEE